MSAELSRSTHLQSSPEEELFKHDIHIVLAQPSDYWIQIFSQAAEATTDVLNEINENAFILDDELAEASKDLPLNREIIRSTHDAHPAAIRVALACSRAIVDAPSSDPKQNDPYWMLRSSFNTTQQADTHIKVWASLVADHLPVYRHFRSISPSVAAAVSEHMQDKEAAQYDLLKAFLKPFEDDGTRPDSWDGLRALLYFEAYSGTTNVSAELTQNLEKGVFDNFLAKDILKSIADNPKYHDIAQYKKLANMWRFSRVCAPDTPESDLIDRMVANRSYWPTEALSALDSLRRQAGSQLKINSTVGRYGFEAFGLIPTTRDPRQELQLCAQAFNAARPKQFAQQVYTKSEIMLARVAEKRRRQPPQQRKSEDDITTSPEINNFKPRSLRLVGRDGEIYSCDDPKGRSIIDEYAREHKGANGLAEDVEKILQHLAAADLSHGLIRGLTNYHMTTTVGESSYDVYGFKPLDATGLSTKSRAAKSIRVICAYDETDMYIFRIIDKKVFDTLRREKSLV